MTIMVLGLDVPAGLSEGELNRTLHRLGPAVGIYLLSFFILGRIWLVHHARFQHIARIDRTFAVLSLCSLAFVALVPAGTSLVSDYPHHSHAIMIYTAAFAIITGFDFAAWRYAIGRGHLIKKELGAQAIRSVDIRNLTFLGFAVASIAMAYIVPEFALYFLLFLLVAAPWVLHWVTRRTSKAT